MQDIVSGENRFYMNDEEGELLAEITYVSNDKGKTIIIDHTFVSEKLRGQGIGKRLIDKVAEYARNENKKIIPLCTYAKKVMTRDKNYSDVL